METNNWVDNKNLRGAAIIILSIGALFLFVKTLKEVKSFNETSNPNAQEHVITVSGKGEITAVADIATFSFSATEDGATVKEAQDKATTKNNAALKFLKDNGIEDRDIKTLDYNIYPQYKVVQAVCINGNCPPSSQEISGYEVSQTIEVKVRDASKAGDMLSGLGSIGVSNLSGLQFTVDDEDTLMHQARSKAIDDAQAQAKQLASDLGVDLGGITSFSENSGGNPMPIFAAKDMAEAPAVAGAAPQLPSGENKITSYVTISYLIK